MAPPSVEVNRVPASTAATSLVPSAEEAMACQLRLDSRANQVSPASGESQIWPPSTTAAIPVPSPVVVTACHARAPELVRASQSRPASVSTTGITATGASLTAVMLIVKVLVVETSALMVRKVKVSEPLALAVGVNVPEAVPVNAPPDKPAKEPFVGWVSTV